MADRHRNQCAAQPLRLSRNVCTLSFGSRKIARNRQVHCIPQAQGDERSDGMTVTNPSISPGTAGLQHVRVIAYPLGECSSEAVTVSTKARKRVGCGWPFSFAWRHHAQGAISPTDFIATRFSTAADKAEFGNTLLRFIESEWAPALFTKSFYNRLSMCFSHIAHYNHTQFYEEWFSSLAAQVRFLKHTLRFPCYGDPEYTFSDVEKAIQREIVNRNYLARYELRLAEEQQATDLALLRQLESKYRTPVEERVQELQLAVPPVDQTPVTPIQGSLF